MKTLKITFLLITFVLLSPMKSLAQNQMLAIHKDNVKPSMQAEYVQVCKDLVEACQKYDLKNSDWRTVRIDDGSYIYVSNIKNMAELDVNTFAPLAEKMGQDNLTALFARFNPCYDSHGDFLVTLRNDLSYQPAKASSESQNFLKYHFFYVTPENSKKVAAKMKEIKELFAKKGSKEYYNIYHSGFGVMDEYYVAVVASKDELTYETTSLANDNLLGEDGKNIFKELYVLSAKYDQKLGRVLPDLSYIAKK